MCDRHDISMCVDCLIFIANGDVPEDRPNLPDEIAAKWSDEDGVRWEIVTACPENCEGTFSRWPCDCCGSPLGGERHPGIAVPRPVSPATQR